MGKEIKHYDIEPLFKKVRGHIDNAKKQIQTTVDTEMVLAYWNIGKDIIKEEQDGQDRAEYGTNALENLSSRLKKHYGKGFSVSTLRDIRRFYLVFINREPIHHAVRGESKNAFSPELGWLHYRKLMRIEDINKRHFYEVEAENNRWNGRELERQVDSLLFERLSKSKDKVGLMRLANEGQEIEIPGDAIKEPMILEFLGLPENHRLVESKLEEALINNLQHFLLELGKGFAFIARQKRLSFDGDHFYADLVFYHAILKCYVILDLKVGKLTHGDLGQMQLYVNYFDKEIKMESDNSTIGIVLCSKKNKAVAKYMLGEQTSKRVFTSEYKLHLPTEEELERELNREVREVEKKIEDNDSHQDSKE
tara:strand:+ start:522 stop:1616 length:1095 start_codon:yes stop_codon:yes gene_type:complete